MKKLLARGSFRLTKNLCFVQVIDQCSKVKRQGQSGTWITQEMKDAYTKLHKEGHVHSYEVWEGAALVGGLYGVDLGHVFCGESMFSQKSNASKFALIKLAQELEEKKYRLIDCQVYTEHMASMGAEELSRKDFLAILTRSG